jgi:branched-chain amino acid transport system ATP-binding protein
VRLSAGEVAWEDRKLNRLRTEQVVKLGLSLVPQSRGLFMGLTVAENLSLACIAFSLSRKEVREREEEIYARFPSLVARRDVPAASLSGGEQQMLAIGKALMRKPRLLILDEPSTGLAPKVLEDIAALIHDLRDGDLSIMLTEQNVHWALGMVDTVYVIEQGAIVEHLESGADTGKDVDRLLGMYLGAAGVKPSGSTA